MENNTTSDNDINKIYRYACLLCLATQEKENLDHSSKGLEEMIKVLEDLKELHYFHVATFFYLNLWHLFKIEKKKTISKDAPQSETTNIIHYDF